MVRDTARVPPVHYPGIVPSLRSGERRSTPLLSIRVPPCVPPTQSGDGVSRGDVSRPPFPIASMKAIAAAAVLPRWVFGSRLISAGGLPPRAATLENSFPASAGIKRSTSSMSRQRTRINATGSVSLISATASFRLVSYASHVVAVHARVGSSIWWRQALRHC